MGDLQVTQVALLAGDHVICKISVDYFEKNRSMFFWMMLFFGKSKCFVGRFIGGWNKNAAKRFMSQGHANSFAGVSQPLRHNCFTNKCASEGSAGGAAREGGPRGPMPLRAAPPSAGRRAKAVPFLCMRVSLAPGARACLLRLLSGVIWVC